jgi:CRP-like cAMP-binding protein
MWLDPGDAALTWAGYLGVAFYVGAYAALQGGIIRGAGYLYALLNLVAASLVLVSLANAFSLSAAMVQIFWIAISAVGLTRLFLINRRIRFDAEEQTLLGDALPDLGRLPARRFLDRGVWSVQPPGATLTVEGRPVTELHYLLNGSADVVVGARTIAELDHGLVGEMNVLKEGPASATVRVTEPSRVFTISGRNLRALAQSDADFRAHLHERLSHAMQGKLTRANARLAGADRGR